MAVFTMRLKDLLSQRDDIGLSDYPIFDERHRKVLNDKIISRYYHREIGHETDGMFVLAMRRKMHEIMPLYNQLYESERLKFNPLAGREYVETVANASESETSETQTGTSKTANTTDSKARAVNSETPQTMLAGNQDYATSASDSVSHTGVESDAETAGETSGKGVTSGTLERRITEKGGGSEMLTAYRNTILNIDLMIVSELATLFMQVWDAGESFTY